MDIPAVLYTRDLPGGGHVSIEGHADSDNLYRALLTVERRAEHERRLGHIPPVLVEVAGDTQGSVFRQLLAVADSNVAIASALRRWQAERREAKD